MAKQNKCLKCNKRRPLVPQYTVDKESKKFIIIFICQPCKDKEYELPFRIIEPDIGGEG